MIRMGVLPRELALKTVATLATVRPYDNTTREDRSASIRGDGLSQRRRPAARLRSGRGQLLGLMLELDQRVGSRKTILITDDDPTHRDLLREVLAPLGFILLSAPDGPGCLALASIAGPTCSCSTSRWPAWTAGRSRRRCAPTAITKHTS
jgi:hypothetical protein